MKNNLANSLLLKDESFVLFDINDSTVKHLNQSGHIVLNQKKLRSKILFMFLLNDSELLVFCYPNIVHRFIVFLPRLNQSFLKLKKSFRLHSIDSPLVGGCRTDDSHFVVFTKDSVHYHIIGSDVVSRINHYELKNRSLSIKSVDYFHNLDEFGQLNIVIATENYLIQWNVLTNRTHNARQKKIKWLKVVRSQDAHFPIIVTENDESVTLWTSGFRCCKLHYKSNFTERDTIFASPNLLFYCTKKTKDLVVHPINHLSFSDFVTGRSVMSASQMRNFSDISPIQNGIVAKRRYVSTDTEYERLIYYSQVESLVQLCIRSLTHSKRIQESLTKDSSILPQDLLIPLNESILLKKNPFHNELKKIQ